jgi:hypothetical protein
MVALPARDEALARGLAALEEVLPRELDAGFDCFRPAAHEVGIGKAAGLVAEEMVGQGFRGLGREEGGVRISELRSLPRNRLEDARMLMAEAGDGRTSRSVENPPAVFRNQPDAFAADRLGWCFTQAPVQHAA